MSSLKDFNQSFHTMRSITIVSVLGFIVATIVYIFQYHRIQEYYQQQTYVITNWGTFPASYYDGRKVSKIEAQNHVETFVKNMFAHSAETYYEHINYALNLIDEESGKRIYYDFEEGEVHKNYVRYGSHTEIKLDSVVLDMNTFPNTGKLYALQEVHIGNDVRSLPIAASFQIIQSYRHEKNPYGLELTNFDFIAYDRQAPLRVSSDRKPNHPKSIK